MNMNVLPTSSTPAAPRRLSRRQALQLAGALGLSAPLLGALAACTPQSGGAPGRGDSKSLDMHLLTWATADGTTIREKATPLYKQATGGTLVTDQPAAGSGGAAKIQAAAKKQWTDLATLLGSDILALDRESLLVKPDVSKIPNAAHVDPKYQLVHNDSAVGFASAVYGLTYNKKIFSSAPDSLSVLWDDRYAGKLLLPPPNFVHAMQLVVIAGVLEGVDAFEKPDIAFKKLEKLKGRVLTFSSQPEQVGQLFRNGDLALGYTSFAALSSAIKNEDFNIGVSIRQLKEGWVSEILGLAIPVNHPNPIENVYELINIILSPEIAIPLQEAAWYVPLSKEAKTPQRLLDLGFPGADDLSKAITYDLNQLAEVRDEWSERYQNIFGA